MKRRAAVATRKFLLGICLCALLTSPLCADDFRALVGEEFEAWIVARQRLLDSAQPEAINPTLPEAIDPTLPESIDATLPDRQQLIEQLTAAYRDLLAAVTEHWPDPPPKDTDEEASVERSVIGDDSPPALWADGALAPAAPKTSAASSALRAASDFEKKSYVGGDATREEAVSRWIEVADRFPGALEHDEALFRGAVLYGQRLTHGAKRDFAAAEKVFARLAARPGPPTTWTLHAEENLTGFISDPAQRMLARSRLYRELVKLQQIDELKQRVLVPNPNLTPRQFILEIDRLLAIAVAIRRTTAAGMVFDAGKGPDRQEHLELLEKRHADDPQVRQAIDRLRASRAPVTGSSAPTSELQ